VLQLDRIDAPEPAADRIRVAVHAHHGHARGKLILQP
jgi:hypothetical protein